MALTPEELQQLAHNIAAKRAAIERIRVALAAYDQNVEVHGWPVAHERGESGAPTAEFFQVAYDESRIFAPKLQGEDMEF